MKHLKTFEYWHNFTDKNGKKLQVGDFVEFSVDDKIMTGIIFDLKWKEINVGYGNEPQCTIDISGSDDQRVFITCDKVTKI